MSQLLNHYRTMLLKRSRNIRDGKQSLRWHFSQTMQLAKETTLFLYLLLEESIAADVLLTVPSNPKVGLPPSVEELRQKCHELAEQLNRANLGLSQQVEITLGLIGQIAQLVSLQTEQAKQINTLHRATLAKNRRMSSKGR